MQLEDRINDGTAAKTIASNKDNTSKDNVKVVLPLQEMRQNP